VVGGSVRLLAAERPWNTDQVCSRAAILRDSREGVNSSIFSHGYRINVSRPLAVLEKDGTVVGVLCPWNVNYPLTQRREIPCLVPAVVNLQLNSGYIIDDLFQFGDSIRILVVLGYFTPIFSQVSNWTASSSTLEGMESSVLPRSTATLKPYSASSLLTASTSSGDGTLINTYSMPIDGRWVQAVP